MELKIEKGRPADISDRLPKEIKVYDYLDGLGIEYDRVDHAAYDTMEDCTATDELLGVGTVKNLLFCNSQKTEFQDKGAFKADRLRKAFLCKR